MGISIDIIAEFMSLSAADVWSCLEMGISSCGAVDKTVVLDGKTCFISEVGNALEEYQMPQFRVELSEGIVDYGHVRDGDHSVVRIQDLVDKLKDGDMWVKPFCMHSSFIQAWIYDSEYNYWQNADDLLEYRTAGREFHDLPLISNGLPYPLAQQIVDTSRNPGRRVIFDGYIEAVGAEMWIGEEFIKRTGASSFLSSNLFDCREFCDGVYKLKAADSVFLDEDGMKSLQIEMRDLLFNARALD